MTAPVIRFSTLYIAGVAMGVLGPLPSLALPAGVVVGLFGWRLGHPSSAAAALGLLVGYQERLAVRHRCEVRLERGRTALIVRIRDNPGRRGLSEVESLEPSRCTGRLRVRAPEGLELQAGRSYVVVGTVGRHGRLTITHARLLGVSRSLRWYLRDRIRTRITTVFGERAPIVEALVLGIRSDVPSATRSVFVASGLAHLLAISGLHIGMLAIWVVMALGRVTDPRRARLLGTGIIWGYVWMLGAPVSAVRAASYLTIRAIAGWRQRTPSPSGVLAVTALVLVTADPGAVMSVGAWLSCAAVAGTQWGLDVLRGYRRRPGWLLQSLAVSTGATLATAPITALVFGNVAPIGVVANLVAVPLAGLAVPGVFFGLVAGGAAATGAGLALEALRLVAEFGAALPFGNTIGPPGLRFAAPWLLLLVVVMAVMHRRPTLPVLRVRGWRVAAAAALAWAMTPMATRWAGAMPMSMTVLDVGQGDAIALRTPGGRWILIDAGPTSRTGNAGDRVVVPFLRRQGAASIAVLFLSHGDADHVGGAPAVVRHFDPDMVVEPGQPLGTATYGAFHDALEASGAAWRAGRAGDTVVVDSVVVAVLHPPEDWVSDRLDQNENSLVLHVRYRNFDILLAGDTGFPAESLFVSGRTPVEILKVGHHGSRFSTGDPLLAELTPSVAVISVGTGNRYGHPARDLLTRLEERGIEIWRTDRDGAVTIRSDGDEYDIRSAGKPYWWERVRCLVRKSSPSSGSSSSRSACSRRRRAN